MTLSRRGLAERARSDAPGTSSDIDDAVYHEWDHGRADAAESSPPMCSAHTRFTVLPRTWPEECRKVAESHQQPEPATADDGVPQPG
jgi:hypothetical protein